jgi:hypothetical protein
MSAQTQRLINRRASIATSVKDLARYVLKAHVCEVGEATSRNRCRKFYSARSGALPIRDTLRWSVDH